MATRPDRESPDRCLAQGLERLAQRGVPRLQLRQLGLGAVARLVEDDGAGGDHGGQLRDVEVAEQAEAEEFGRLGVSQVGLNGKFDKIIAYPATRGYRPSDLGATIYSALGVDPASLVSDQLGRPLQLNQGEVIKPLFTGSSV